MSAPNVIPEWVRAFCARERYGRPNLEQPHTVTWRGAPAIAATNGHKLVIVAGDFEGTPFETIGPNVPALMDAALAQPGRPLRLSALRAFAGLPPEPPAFCATCRNEGVIECPSCDGDGEVDCECDCGHEHEKNCEDCYGAGDQPCPECKGGQRQETVVPVLISGTMFNRNLLAEVARALPLPADDAPVMWHGTEDRGFETKPAGIAGDGWAVLVMPMRSDGYEATATFEAWEQAVSA